MRRIECILIKRRKNYICQDEPFAYKHFFESEKFPSVYISSFQPGDRLPFSGVARADKNINNFAYWTKFCCNQNNGYTWKNVAYFIIKIASSVIMNITEFW